MRPIRPGDLVRVWGEWAGAYALVTRVDHGTVRGTASVFLGNGMATVVDLVVLDPVDYRPGSNGGPGSGCPASFSEALRARR